MGCGELSPVTVPHSASSLHNGTIASLYQKRQLVGKGTYGKVYRCVSRKDNSDYALKVVELNSKNREEAIKDIQNLKSEISVLRRLNHQNIIKYYNFEVSTESNSVEMVLELVDGGSLSEYIKQRGPIDEKSASQFCKQILTGLHYLHQQKIIHRDLKCANLLITKDGIIKITDFGTAKVIHMTSASANDDIAKLSASLKGTPYYMAPQVLKRTGHTFSADIWSLGCTLIEMLTGKAPWTGISNKFQQIIGYISSGIHPPFPPKISTSCQRFLQACLDTIPSKRLTAQQLLKHDFIDLTKRRKSGYGYSQQNNNSTPFKQYEHQSNYTVANDFNKNATVTKERPKIKSDRKQVRGKNSKKQIFHHEQQKVFVTPFEINMSNKEPGSQNYSNKSRNPGSSKLQASKTSTTVKMTEENVIASGLHEYKLNRHSKELQFEESGLRINTQTESNRLKQGVINTQIAMAERSRYLEQQRKLQQLKDNERKKWEDELKQEASLFKKQIENSYSLHNQ